MNLKSTITALARSPIFAAFMTSVKRFPRAAVSFLLLSAALFLFSASAFAEFRSDSSFVAVSSPSLHAVSGTLDLAAGSAIDGALGALGVKLSLGTGALLTTYDLIQSVVRGNPFGTLGYEYNGTFYDIADQSTIRIRDDVVTIDGVEYKDIWLSHDAAVKFRVNAFDFITYYNIISQSSGTYLSGVGFYDGIPMFTNPDQPNYVYSQLYLVDDIGNYQIGNLTVNSYWYKPNEAFRVRVTTSSGYVGGPTNAIYSTPEFLIRFSRAVTDSGCTASVVEPYGGNITLTGTASLYVASPFDFDWVSSTIPAQELPEDQGLRFRVPSSYVAGFPSTLDPSLADYSSYLKSLGDALEQARLADAVESTAFEEYDAPAPPVPSTGTIAEEPYTSLDGSLNGIQDSLDNIDTNIGTVDESLDDIQVYAEDAADSLQSIDTNLSQSVADTAGIKGFIQQYLPGVHSLLNSISSSVSNIAGSIAAADSTFFGNVVDSILAPFTPVFDIFKSGVGIWRYVVAWVGNISAPFSWIWSTLSQANGILVSPILASAAAAVVLAVYKRFGR